MSRDIPLSLCLPWNVKGRPLSLSGVWLSLLNLKEFRKHMHNVKKSPAFSLSFVQLSRNQYDVWRKVLCKIYASFISAFCEYVLK